MYNVYYLVCTHVCVYVYPCMRIIYVCRVVAPFLITVFRLSIHCRIGTHAPLHGSFAELKNICTSKRK